MGSVVVFSESKVKRPRLKVGWMLFPEHLSPGAATGVSARRAGGPGRLHIPPTPWSLGRYYPQAEEQFVV